MPTHYVKKGECIESIASDYGFFWEKIWNHENNSSLRKLRKNPDIVLEGDEVFVPEKEKREEIVATDETHRFVVKGVPSKLRIRLMDDDKPYANMRYKLTIDDSLSSGTTDSEGWLVISIPPGAKSGKLVIGDEQDQYDLELGYLDPIDQVTGIQARLNNLGFECGTVDGILGPKTVAAIQRFQSAHGLKITGDLDSNTRKSLEENYGC